uniref:Photosystem I reaction center subunit PsaK n=1 Tax=Sarcopeltis skottsbergii TaxID=2765380 RepID=A0A7M1VIB8_SARSK|nr:photosystem I subunit X [Sarcopeltis skottsbergii]
MDTNILLTITPYTATWSPKIAIIMIICNFISIGIGRYAIQVRGLGPSIPILGLQGFGLPELLATTSLGHVIGAGTIIGLSSIGIIS